MLSAASNELSNQVADLFVDHIVAFVGLHEQITKVVLQHQQDFVAPMCLLSGQLLAQNSLVNFFEVGQQKLF